MFEIHGKNTNAKVMIDDVEPECIAQIQVMCNHPAFTNPVAIMPDTHAGKGSVIGFTMKTGDKIVPNVVGTDVGCQITACNVGKIQLPPFDLLDMRIRKNVPMGFEINQTKRVRIDDYPWDTYMKLKTKITSIFGTSGKIQKKQSKEDEFKNICTRIGADVNNVLRSAGSLGGGNHFLEIGLDNDGNTWFTVHTGSRNLGLKVCNYWQDIATKKFRTSSKEEYKQKMAEIKASCMGKERGEKLKLLKDEYSEQEQGKVPKDLEYLESDDAVGYMHDMAFAQVYAQWNHSIIIDQMLQALGVSNVLDTVSSTHNFIDFNDMVIRKGAIRSYKGERMVIPMNMKDGSLICEGKSNPEWCYSCAHGAGRLMSRSQAKRELSQDDADEQMKAAGIFTTNVPLDEAPDAYKDAKVIEAAIEPTATVINRIRPIHNLKA